MSFLSEMQAKYISKKETSAALKKVESKNLDVKERSLSIIHLALVNFSKSLKVK